MLTTIFLSFYFQYDSAMATDTLNITARCESIFGPDKVNVQQSISSGRAI
jgi:hypothetical protein